MGFFKRYNINQSELAANKYFKLNNAQIVVTAKGSEVIENIEKVTFNGKSLPVLFFDKKGNKIDKPIFKKEIKDDVTVQAIILVICLIIGYPCF